MSLSSKIIGLLCRIWITAEHHFRAEYYTLKARTVRASLGFCGSGVTINPECKWLGCENIYLAANVFINHGSIIQGEGGLHIGENTIIGPNVTIWTVNHDIRGEKLPFGKQRVFKPVKIGRDVWIGINVTIVPGVEIGDGAVIGAGAVIAGVVPPLAIVAPEKWRVVGSRDEEHYRRLRSEDIS